jgi:hypothetical protein
MNLHSTIVYRDSLGGRQFKSYVRDVYSTLFESEWVKSANIAKRKVRAWGSERFTTTVRFKYHYVSEKYYVPK